MTRQWEIGYEFHKCKQPPKINWLENTSLLHCECFLFLGGDTWSGRLYNKCAMLSKTVTQNCFGSNLCGPTRHFAWYYTKHTCSITKNIPYVSVCCISCFWHINTAGALAKSHQLKAEPFPMPTPVGSGNRNLLYWLLESGPSVSVFLLCCSLLVDSHWVNTHTRSHGAS